jgi:hypothetical protein
VDDNELLATVADLARRAGADEPDRLARTLTLLLDGALSISSEHRMTLPLRSRGKPHTNRSICDSISALHRRKPIRWIQHWGGPDSNRHNLPGKSMLATLDDLPAKGLTLLHLQGRSFHGRGQPCFAGIID